MGYTHYWHRKVDGSEPIPFLARTIADMAEIIRRSPVPLAGLRGKPGTEPETSERGVVFNGLGDLSYEPFEFLIALENRPWETDIEPWTLRFCKTERKPYDAVVTACLLAAKHHLGEYIRIWSDGEWGADWRDGADLYELVFPERAPAGCPLEPRRR